MLALARSVPMLFAARLVDGLSGGNISTARAYVADITTEDERAKAYGLIGAAFGIGFVLGPALGGALGAHELHGAHLGGGGPHAGRHRAGVGLAAGDRASRGAPARGRSGAGCATRSSAPAAAPAADRGPGLLDGVGGVPGHVRALVCARRFGFDVPHVGYVLASFGVLGVIVQVGLVGPRRRALGERRVFALGLLLAAIGSGWRRAGARRAGSSCSSLVPYAIGSALCTPSLASLISRPRRPEEQGTRAGRGVGAREPRQDDRTGVGQRRCSSSSAAAPRSARVPRWLLASIALFMVGRKASAEGANLARGGVSVPQSCRPRSSISSTL